ncbi:phosphomevalonate kinase-like [Penaeus indicus]|uniref:phosphomevalonate kinase-like n=1 Tax=Penaeus indicus TaxID=29960 RepID=UPI00300D266F
MVQNPKLVLLFSGKRKSGKDYITDLLQERLGNAEAKTVRLSGPIKQQFAANNGLDYSSLLSASEYKEKYRLQMIEWSEAKRAEDSGFFIRAAIEMYEGVDDAESECDLDGVTEWDSEVDNSGVDDAESECDLDGVTEWDSEVDNSGDARVVEELLEKLTVLCASKRNE